MSDAAKVMVLVVSGDHERRDRAVGVLGGFCEVVPADDMGSAMDELSLGEQLTALIDTALPRDAVTGLISAIGDLDRVVLWVPEIELDLLEYGAFIQVPYGADDRILVAAVERAVEAQRLKEGVAKPRELSRRLAHVIDVAQGVQQEMSTPLTSILAEAELMLMDADQLSDEQKKSLETIETMAYRMRELAQRLHELKTG